MTFRFKHARTLMMVSMTCLLISLVWPRFIHLGVANHPDLVDFLRGMLIGFSIGGNLMVVWLNSRKGGPCANA